MSLGEPAGTVGALWRFPVKSMLGEQLDEVDVEAGGVVGDRAFAVVDVESGKVASAKHPKVRDPEILKTLAQDNRLDFAGAGSYPCAGVYAVVTASGTIRTGYPVTSS
jgi:uncharacterized protein YcbX